MSRRHASDVSIPAGSETIVAALQVPAAAKGLVLFAHGSGSSRHSPRNELVADVLYDAGFATLLLDLLTPDEERIDRRTGHLRFDIDFLAQRLVAATQWARRQPALAALPCSYFGASTGAAAALEAAASLPGEICAIVSRGGRPDLARRLKEVRVPVLLIVGGADPETLQANREASQSLRAETELTVLQGQHDGGVDLGHTRQERARPGGGQHVYLGSGEAALEGDEQAVGHDHVAYPGGSDDQYPLEYNVHVAKVI